MKRAKKNLCLRALLALTLACVVSVGVFGLRAATAPLDTAVASNYPEEAMVGDCTNDTKLPTFLLMEQAQTIAKEKMVEAYRAMIDVGFDMGTLWREEVGGSVREWAGYGVQEFRGGSHTANKWGRVHGYLVIGSLSTQIQAGAVVNEIMLAWADNVASWGAPNGNRFTASDKNVYQNFMNGYAKVVGGAVGFVSGKQIDAALNVTDRIVVPAEVGAIKFGSQLPAFAQEKQDDIKRAFVEAYTRMEESGYDLGIAESEVEAWLPENTVMSQKFVGGDNRGNPYSWGKQGRLMLNDGSGKAFALVDSQLNTWASKGGFGSIGYPLTDVFKYRNAKYQIFSKSYMKIDDLEFSEVISLHAGKFDPKDVYEAEYADGLAAVTYNFFHKYRLYNNRTGNFGYPTGYVRRQGDLYIQEFRGGDNASVSGYLIQRGVDGAAAIVYGKSADMFMQLGEKKMGYPLGDRFVYKNKEYQNYSKGYYNITDDTYAADYNFTQTGKEVDPMGFAPHADLGVLSTASENYPDESTKTAFTDAYGALTKAGHMLGAPDGKVAVNNGVAIQYFSNSDSDHDKITALVKGQDSDVYSVANAFMTAYVQNRECFGDAEYPVGEAFAYGRKVYQNFKGGYIVCDYYGNTQYVSGMNFVDGEFVSLKSGMQVNNVPDNVGRFGDITRVPAEYRNKQDVILAKFQAEYARLMKMGFYPGETDGELVHQWAPGSFKWINQTFYRGDSTSEMFGSQNAMKIFLMGLDYEAYSVVDTMMMAWLKLGSLGTVGYPTANEVYVDGNLYQNFNGGYIVCFNCDYNNARFIPNDKFVAPVTKEGMTATTRVAVIVMATVLGAVALTAAALAVTVGVKSRRRKRDESVGND